MLKNAIYYGELERFGYTLTAVGKTEQDVTRALLKEYKKAYKQWNELARLSDDPEFKEYYERAKDDLKIIELEFNKVEWL